MCGYTDEFKEKVVVVTGAARHIGLGPGERFAALGARVAVADISGGAVKERTRSVGDLPGLNDANIEDMVCFAAVRGPGEDRAQ